MLSVPSETVLQLGCGLIAFGPFAVFFNVIVAARSQLVIIAIISAFFWLLSAVTSGLLWSIVPSLQSSWIIITTVGVLIQEAYRIALLRVVFRVEAYLKAKLGSSPEAEEAMPLNDLTTALAAGCGFGAAHAAVHLGGPLAAAAGPGTAYPDQCPGVPLVLLQALLALAFGALDVCLTVMAARALRQTGGARAALLAAAAGWHLAAAGMTVLNTLPEGCIATVILEGGVVFWVVYYTKGIAARNMFPICEELVSPYYPDGDHKPEADVLSRQKNHSNTFTVMKN